MIYHTYKKKLRDIETDRLNHFLQVALLEQVAICKKLLFKGFYH